MPPIRSILTTSTQMSMDTSETVLPLIPTIRAEVHRLGTDLINQRAKAVKRNFGTIDLSLSSSSDAAEASFGNKRSRITVMFSNEKRIRNPNEKLIEGTPFPQKVLGIILNYCTAQERNNFQFNPLLRQVMLQANRDIEVCTPLEETTLHPNVPLPIDILNIILSYLPEDNLKVLMQDERIYNFIMHFGIRDKRKLISSYIETFLADFEFRNFPTLARRIQLIKTLLYEDISFNLVELSTEGIEKRIYNILVPELIAPNDVEIVTTQIYEREIIGGSGYDYKIPIQHTRASGHIIRITEKTRNIFDKSQTMKKLVFCHHETTDQFYSYGLYDDYGLDTVYPDFREGEIRDEKMIFDLIRKGHGHIIPKDAFTNRKDEFLLDCVKADLKHNKLDRDHRSVIFAHNPLEVVKINGLFIDSKEENEEIIFSAVSQNPLAVKALSEKTVNKLQIPLARMGNKVGFHLFSRYSVLRSRDFVITSEKFWNFVVCRESVKIAIEDCGKTFGLVRHLLSDDDEMVLAAVKKDGLNLQFASPRLRESEPIVKAAIENCPVALAYAARKFQKPAMMKIAFGSYYKEGDTRSFTEMMGDFVEKQIQDGKLTLKEAGPAFENNKKIALAAIKRDFDEYHCISKTLQEDSDILLELFSHDINPNLEGVEAFENAEFFLKVYNRNYSSINYAADALLKKRELFHKCMETSGQCYRLMDVYALWYDPHNDYEVVADDKTKLEMLREFNLTILKRWPGDFASTTNMFAGFKYYSLSFDKPFVLAAVKIHGSLLRCASNELKNDPEVVRAAMENDPKAFFYASDIIQTDPEFLKLIDVYIEKQNRFELV